MQASRRTGRQAGGRAVAVGRVAGGWWVGRQAVAGGVRHLEIDAAPESAIADEDDSLGDRDFLELGAWAGVDCVVRTVTDLVSHAYGALMMKLQPRIGFWGTNTMPFAGTMAYHQNLPSTTSRRKIETEVQFHSERG